MKPINIKKIQRRSRDLQVRQVDRQTFVVDSATNPIAHHIVTVRFGRDQSVHARCTCQWALYEGVACQHVLAALDYLARRKGRRLSFWLNEEEAERQKHRLFYLHGPHNNDGIWITSRKDA